MRNPRRLITACLLPALIFGLLAAALLTAGCAATPQAKIDQAEILYGTTLATASDAYEAGLIPPATYHNVVTPARKIARKEIDRAKAAHAAGNDSTIDAILNAARDALLQIQAQSKVNTPSSIGPASPFEPMQAVVDPVSAGLLVLTLIQRLAPVAQKLFSGQELTPEERTLYEKVSADETARADKDDADAASKIG